MAKLSGLFVCMLIVALDVGAGILGIEAEVAQNKVKHLRLWIFECREPSEDAFKLGLAAAALLAFAHILSNLLGGCMCICSQEDFQKASPNRQLSVDNISRWILHAGDRDIVKPQIKDFLWLLTPSLSVHWRDSVFCACPLLCCLLRFCHSRSQ
uniref:Uncharacterized protein n=1 Tax=Vitis vinifera TaxID=29760 RepID=A5AKI6_VITVI|nr:hypothetical protein VITISV_041413 [Vitis vinifera]